MEEVPHLVDVRLHHQRLILKDLLRVEKPINLLLAVDHVKMIQEVRHRHLLVNQVNKNVVLVQVQGAGQRKKGANVAQQKNCNQWMQHLWL